MYHRWECTSGGGKPDISTEIFGRKISMPIFLSPTAMQRLYDPEGDRASARIVT